MSLVRRITAYTFRILTFISSLHVSICELAVFRVYVLNLILFRENVVHCLYSVLQPPLPQALHVFWQHERTEWFLEPHLTLKWGSSMQPTLQFEELQDFIMATGMSPRAYQFCESIVTDNCLRCLALDYYNKYCRLGWLLTNRIYFSQFWWPFLTVSSHGWGERGGTVSHGSYGYQPHSWGLRSHDPIWFWLPPKALTSLDHYTRG